MPKDNVTPLREAIERESRRQHARSRMAGRLMGIFSQICSAAQEATECGLEYNDPVLTALGRIDSEKDGSHLHWAARTIIESASELMRVAEPDSFPGQRPDGDAP